MSNVDNFFEQPKDGKDNHLNLNGTWLIDGVEVTQTAEKINDLPNLNGTTNIQFDTSISVPYRAGQISYDPITKTHLLDTGYPEVRTNSGQQLDIRFFNDTGLDIPNGSVINAAGFDATNGVIKGILADASNPLLSSAIVGISTHEVKNGTVGLATTTGEVNGLNTLSFSPSGIIYASDTTPGGLTQTRPLYPGSIVIMGSVEIVDEFNGRILAKPTPFRRFAGNKSYSFTSSGILAGIHYVGGYYNFASSNTNLSQASLTQDFGLANVAYGAHASAVFGGAGSVDAGQVGLRVTGTSINDAGIRAGSDSEVITDDITTLTADQYLETAKKWLGTITYELFTVSGTPVTFNLNLNYGFSKYEDLGNRDFTIIDFEAIGEANASDTGFNIELLHHKTTGWTYAASNFIPGDGNIVSWSDDMAPEDNLANNVDYAYKRSGLSQFIAGGSDEGIIVRITAGANNSVQTMDVHLGAVIEELIL